MSRRYMNAPCWVVRDADGKPYDDEWDAHHTNSEEALDAIRQIHEDHEEDQTPEEFAADIASRRGPEAGVLALWSEQREIERRETLHPVALDGCCYMVTCDGGGSWCWEQPNGEEGHLHFGPGGEFDPASWDFTVVGDRHYCGDCFPPERAVSE